MAHKNPQSDNAAKPSIKEPATTPLHEESAPEELTGRASATDDDLTALVRNDSQAHFTDGFSGGSGDDSGVAIENDDDVAAAAEREEPDSE
jgi:hypothetical protein